MIEVGYGVAAGWMVQFHSPWNSWRVRGSASASALGGTSLALGRVRLGPAHDRPSRSVVGFLLRSERDVGDFGDFSG